MRALIACVGIAVLGCSATNAALVGLSTASAVESINAAAERDAQRTKEEAIERVHQQTPSCCGTKLYDSSVHSWRCTGCDH